jgi:SAM-dependent methyltransferase
MPQHTWSHNQVDRLKEIVKRAFPWGRFFATRANFEAGYFAQEARLVEKYLQTLSDVLIIGAGNGREARPICQHGHRIVCLDFALVYLESGKKLFGSEGAAHVRFLQADVFDGLPFADGGFDFVFFSLYSPSGERRFAAVQNIHRVLRPDGLLLLCSCTPTYRAVHPTARTEGWVWVDSIDQLRREISPCGFKLLESDVDPLRSEYRFSMLKVLKRPLELEVAAISESRD